MTFFSSLQMGGVEFVFKIYLLLCAKDGQDKFIFALRFEDDNIGVSPLATLCCFLYISCLDAWTNHSVWRLTQRHCAVW